MNIKRPVIIFFTLLALLSSGANAFADDNKQEVQVGSGVDQKTALKNAQAQQNNNGASNNQSTAKNGNTGTQQKAAEKKDWKPATVKDCVKGQNTLHLKKDMNCPKGFTKR